ncbi:MAG: (d)CMP kinase [Clostridiales bacterium]|nr:(d)CMP kinase [Clostridiales bacterium]
MKIAIDGPAGSGKSTIAKLIAKNLNITYIDTGAMYRAVTLYFMDKNIPANDLDSIKHELPNIELEFIDNQMHMNQKNVSLEIRTPRVTNNVSNYAKIDIIREDLQNKQKFIALKQSVIMDGRDIGTVVLKDADFKFFLVATVLERARRRLIDLNREGYQMDINLLIEEIERRDAIDASRDHSPLKKADDAIEIDTSKLTIDEVIEKIENIIKRG